MRTTTVTLLGMALLCVGLVSCGKKGADSPDTRTQALRDGNKYFVENVINNGKMDSLDKYIADTFVDHGPPEMPGKGIEGFKTNYAVWKASFPDYRQETMKILVDGNKVVWIGHASGTFKTDFMGIKANGKSFKDVLVMDYVLFNDSNRATDHWFLMDNMSWMTQLGLDPNMMSAPPPGADASAHSGAPAAGADKAAEGKAADGGAKAAPNKNESGASGTAKPNANPDGKKDEKTLMNKN